MTDKQKEKIIRKRADTIVQKLTYLQALEREMGTDLLPSSTEGFIDDLMGVSLGGND